jgi:hypothetical protein
MQITHLEANQLVGEIADFLEERGCDVSDLTFNDYDDLETLLESRNGHRWSGHLQAWIPNVNLD